jgi:hypothetical protein
MSDAITGKMLREAKAVMDEINKTIPVALGLWEVNPCEETCEVVQRLLEVQLQNWRHLQIFAAAAEVLT